MNVEVKLFAVARQLAGCETACVELPEAATVAQLRVALVAQHPPLAEVMQHVMFAVDAEYADEQTSIPHDAEVACIPPVSGG